MSEVADPYDLGRFVDAQTGTYDAALSELRAGAKRGHWIWFVFPQLAGLGTSATAQRFAIGSLEEARAYLAHPVLGPRLRECARALVSVEGRSIEDIVGWPDCLKVRSSMTLFVVAAGDGSDFQQVLTRYYSGAPDDRTLDLLRRD